MNNWHNEFFAELDKEAASVPEFNGFVYCEECYCVVGESDECLCLVDRPDFVQDVLDRARGMQQAANSVGLGVIGQGQCCGGACG